MKKFVGCLLIGCMVLSMAACSTNSKKTHKKSHEREREQSKKSEVVLETTENMAPAGSLLNYSPSAITVNGVPLIFGETTYGEAREAGLFETSGFIDSDFHTDGYSINGPMYMIYECIDDFDSFRLGFMVEGDMSTDDAVLSELYYNIDACADLDISLNFEIEDYTQAQVEELAGSNLVYSMDFGVSSSTTVNVTDSIQAVFIFEDDNLVAVMLQT